MFWIFIIFIGVLPALIAAAAVFFTAARLRPNSLQTRPTHPVLLSLLAGMLWPVLLLGLTEFAIVLLMGRHAGVAAETTALAHR